MKAIQRVEREHLKKFPEFRAGDTVRVHVQVVEGEKVRAQIFEGTVLGRRGGGSRETFLVRKISGNVAVERIFAIHSPSIVKIEKVREGKVIGRQHKYLRRLADRTEAELLQSVLENYYTEATFFPEEVHLSTELADPEPLVEYLREARGKIVHVKVPQRGDKASLIRLVEANANLLLDEWKLQQIKRGEDRIPHVVKALKEDLRLRHLPRRIECFDISHLGGTGTVASCVVFEDGKPKKRDYRTYKIRTVEEGRPDDFQSMREVIGRRYRRVLEENGPWPDLVVIDGGKGQLSSAVEALEKTEVYGKFPVIGLAKRLEEVFFPGDSEPKHIAKSSASLQLLQRVRDEAHRFAVTFQRKQRKQRTLHSELLDIEGIGPKTAQKLLKQFGSVKRVREASRADLESAVGKAAAEKVRTYFETNAAA